MVESVGARGSDMLVEFERAAHAILADNLTIDHVDAVLREVDRWTQRRLRQLVQVPSADIPIAEGYPAEIPELETDATYRRRQAEVLHEAILGRDRRWWGRWARQKYHEKAWMTAAIERAISLLRPAGLWTQELDDLRAYLTQEDGQNA